MQQSGPIGFKSLWWNKNEKVFYSYWGRTGWNNNCVVAECLEHWGWPPNFSWIAPIAHVAPDENCYCGIYGTYNIEKSLFFGEYHGYHDKAIWIGKTVLVQAGGKVIEHESGFRCERATILSVLEGEHSIAQYLPEIDYYAALEIVKRNSLIQETGTDGCNNYVQGVDKRLL